MVAQARDGADTQDVPGDTPAASRAPSTRTTRTCWCSPTGATPGALMQMYLWDPARDLDLDELPDYRPVHGGDDPVARLPRVHARAHQPAGHGRPGLRRAERRAGGAIDEGTADWYALDYLVGQGRDPYPDDRTPPT